MTGFAAVLTDPQAQPAPAAAFLAARPGFSARSAADFLRLNPGYLGRALTLPAAKELAAAAGAAGLACALFAEEAIPSPPPPLEVSRLELLDGGLRASAGGASLFVRYEEVLVLAAAAWDAPAPSVSAAALAPGVLERVVGLFTGRRPLPERGPLELRLRADLLAAGGERLLLAPEALDFSPLGKALAHSSLENFRLLLDGLRLRVPAAAGEPCLAALLGRAPLAPLKVAGPGAADAGLARLLLLARPRR